MLHSCSPNVTAVLGTSETNKARFGVWEYHIHYTPDPNTTSAQRGPLISEQKLITCLSVLECTFHRARYTGSAKSHEFFPTQLKSWDYKVYCALHHATQRELRLLPPPSLPQCFALVRRCCRRRRAVVVVVVAAAVVVGPGCEALFSLQVFVPA